MAYVLIPDGFTLKKVTKAEQEAVDEYFGRERKGTYIEGFLSNPNTPTLIGGAGFLALSGILIDLLFGSLEKEGVILTDTQKTSLKKSFDISLLLNPVTGPALLGKKAAKSLLDLDFSDLEKRLSGLKFGSLA